MKLDLTMIKNESIVSLEKSLTKVRNKLGDMLSIALDAAINEIDPDKRQEAEHVLSDVLNDEFNKYTFLYTECINKALSLVENSLNK